MAEMTVDELVEWLLDDDDHAISAKGRVKEVAEAVSELTDFEIGDFFVTQYEAYPNVFCSYGHTVEGNGSSCGLELITADEFFAIIRQSDASELSDFSPDALSVLFGGDET